MKRFDSWLIEKHEQFAHWFQRLTGLTNFWLAKGSWVLFSFSMAALACLAFPDRTDKAVGYSFVSTLLFLALVPWVWRLCNRLEIYYLEGSRSAHVVTQATREMWPIRHVFYFFHMSIAIQPYWFVTRLDFWFYLQGFLWLMLIPFSYFVMSIPLPPAKEEETEMLPSPAS